MSFAFVEVITLLLGLGGFGLQPNPKAPTADQALQYAMPDADIIVHFDAQSVIPNNYKALVQLADQPQIKASPDLAKMVRQMVNEVEGARGLAKSTSGVDVTTDIYDATMFLQLPAGREPAGVIAVRGKFSTAVVDKIAKTVGQAPTKIGMQSMVSLERTPRDEGGALGVTKDGVLIVGTQRLVKDRLADSWKAPARAAGSLLAGAANIINTKPVVSMMASLSPAARTHLLGAFNMSSTDKNFVSDMVGRHKFFAYSLYHDGVGWTWTDSSKAGMDSMVQMSEGMIEIMRAAQIAPRGFAKLALGGLESYRGADKRIDEILKRKGDIMKIVDTYTGDGNFKVTWDKDPVAYRVGVRATGKSLAEVMPASALLPGIGAAVFLGGMRKKSSSFDSREMWDKMDSYANRVCGCKDMACVSKAGEDWAKDAARLAKSAGGMGAPTADDKRRGEQLTKKITDCTKRVYDAEMKRSKP